MPWAVAAGSIAGALISSGAASDAAQTQADATRAASDATLQGQRDALEAQKPFLQGGYDATNKLRSLLGLGDNTGQPGFGSLNKDFSFGGDDLANTPGYQFQLGQGQNAIDRKAAAGGGFYSGEGLQGAAAFNQGLAGTTFGDAYNRARDTFQLNRANTLNPLQAMAGQGQTSANTTGQIGMSGANSLAGLITGGANAQGAASIAQGNALAGGLNNGITAWQRANMMKTGGGGNSWTWPGNAGSGGGSAPAMQSPFYDGNAGLSQDWWNTGGGY